MGRLVGAAEDIFERPPVRYSESTPHDAVARLSEELRAGRLALPGDDRSVVEGLLRAFGAKASSQVLVYSKTSLQNDRIGPRHPRALYFSDTVYIGWAPGGLIEVAAMDPALGPVFYSFDPRPGAGASFTRDPDCLRCHGGAFLRDIPGLLARSLYTDDEGRPRLSLGSELMDDASPFDHRWGGWYVTGATPGAVHRGNLFLASDREPSQAALALGSNLTNLAGFFDPGAYLAGASSDIVALLVLEHQITAHNALTRANQHCLRMMAYQEGVQRDLKEPVAAEPEWESVRNAFTGAVQGILDALLFKDEAPFPPGGVQGVNSFAADFESGGTPGPRALRKLDLKSRLLKHRCSHLVFTEEFARLQPTLRRRVLERLWKVLNQPDAEPRYAYLEPAERRAITEVLGASLPDLPSCWTPSPP